MTSTLSRARTRSASAAHPASPWLVRALSESPLTPVLIVGPEAIELAKQLHRATYPRRAPFVHVDCTWLPAARTDEVVFGSVRDGRQRRGLVDRADGGTLFFDDVAELPHSDQAKLAKLIESMRFRRRGGTTEIGVRLRVVAALARGASHALESGQLRRDLHARLSVFTIDGTCSSD